METIGRKYFGATLDAVWVHGLYFGLKVVSLYIIVSLYI